MSIVLMGAVKQRGPAKGPLRLTLLAICDEADDFGFACPSTQSIASGSCCSVRQALRRIQLLEDEGWLQVKRKVFRADAANAYFVDIAKLGIVPSVKSRRSPLWTNVQRILRALESRDRVSLLNGVLKFDKTPDSIDLATSGHLFEDESASDTMSLAESSNEPLESASLGVPEAQFAKTLARPSKVPSEDESASDTMSHVTCHPCHVTCDIQGKPFNVLPVINPLQQVQVPPLAPASGGGEIPHANGNSETLVGLLLGANDESKNFSNKGQGNGKSEREAEIEAKLRAATPADKLEGQLVWVTARVMRAHGFTPDRRMEESICEAFRMHCSKTGCTPEEAANLEAANYVAYQERSHLMTYNWGPRWWFKQGYWNKPGQWPYDKQKLARLRDARVGSGRSVFE